MVFTWNAAWSLASLGVFTWANAQIGGGGGSGGGSGSGGLSALTGLSGLSPET